MATLFGEEEAVAVHEKARTPPPEWLILKLIAAGVLEETARAYENRQAFAVLKRLESAPPRQQPQEEPEPSPKSPAKRGGATVMERRDSVAGLEQCLRDGNEEELHRALPMVLWVLTFDEARRVAVGINRMLRETFSKEWQ
jgi:hypothetical protein